MKLEDYPTPETDAHASFKYGRIDRLLCELAFAKNLEQRLRKANTVLAGIADGMELMSQNPRTTKRIRETLAETHKQ